VQSEAQMPICPPSVVERKGEGRGGQGMAARCVGCENRRLESTVSHGQRLTWLGGPVSFSVLDVHHA